MKLARRRAKIAGCQAGSFCQRGAKDSVRKGDGREGAVNESGLPEFVGQRDYDCRVIDLNHLAIAVLTGAVLIVFGLVPGLSQGVHNLGRLLSSQFPSPYDPDEQSDQPIWLAGVGAALIAAAVLAYLST
jgi:hypothetical protein